MPSEWTAWVPVVGSLGGVVLGAGVTWVRDALRERRELSRESAYLAILVVAHLDSFVDECVQVAFDDGTSEGRPAGDGHTFYQATVSLPTLDLLSLDVDWKVLPARLMYGVLGLPHRLQQIATRLRDPGFNDPPDYSEFFHERQYRFAVFGREVSTLSRLLRVHANLPAPLGDTVEWDRDVLLNNRIASLEAESAASAALHAAAMAATQL